MRERAKRDAPFEGGRLIKEALHRLILVVCRWDSDRYGYRIQMFEIGDFLGGLSR